MTLPQWMTMLNRLHEGHHPRTVPRPPGVEHLSHGPYRMSEIVADRKAREKLDEMIAWYGHNFNADPNVADSCASCPFDRDHPVHGALGEAAVVGEKTDVAAAALAVERPRDKP